MGRSIDKKSKYLEVVGVFVFFNLIVWGILLGTGTLTCGYHMVDDHEILEWVYNLKYQNYSIWDVQKEYLDWDFLTRYRPLYCILRVFSAYFFGMDMKIHSIVNAVIIVITLISLYYCGRGMNASKWSSGMFALTAMVGYQGVVWWKIGPQESFGTMLLAIGFFLLLQWLNRKKIGWAIGSLAVFLLMSLYKESYILTLPFFGIYVVYDSIKEEQVFPSIKEMWRKVKGKIGYIICVALITVATLAALLMTVGVTTGYDGFNLKDSLSVRGYLEVLQNSLTGDLRWYKWFTILFVAVLLTFWDQFKKLWKEMVLLAVFLVPQFLIYAQAGIGERYMLPIAVGYAWFFMIVILNWGPLQGKRRWAYLAGVWLMLLANGRGMVIEADYFRYRGESVTTMLEVVGDLVDDDTKVLSCFRPNEEANWTVYYWLLLHGFDNLYFWTEEEQTINQVCDFNYSYDSNDAEIFDEHNFEEMDIVLMYNQNDRHYCYTPTLDASEFEVIDIGSMTMWVRKDRVSVPEIPRIKNYIYGIDEG